MKLLRYPSVLLFPLFASTLVLAADPAPDCNCKQDSCERVEQQEPGDEPPVNIPLGVSPSRGPSTAPVTVVVFSDFQCPFCSRAAPTLKALEQKYGNKIRIVFKQRPLPLHNQARLAAAAALAANDQGKFWEYHDLLFTQTQLDRPSLERYAQQVGLDVPRFRQALDSGRFNQQIEQESAEADRAHVSGTPTFFINGKRIIGAQPLDAYTQHIDAELHAHR